MHPVSPVMAGVAATGSVFAPTVMFGRGMRSRAKPTSACSREIVSLDEAGGYETLVHLGWHQPRPVVEPGDEPLGLNP